MSDTVAYSKSSTGRPCDKHGDFLDDGVPPPPPQPHSPHDWTPFTSRSQFTTAEFLFKRAKMSAGQIDELLNIWAASSESGTEAPFHNHADLYNVIDAIPIGGVPWQRFEMSFDGARPETDIPPWMEQTYEVYFRDPHQLLLNMLADPTFAKDFDYTPMQKFDCHGSREYGNFMSGDWAWTQAVRTPSISGQILFLIQYSFRTKYRLKLRVQMVPSSFQLSWAATRRRFPLQPARLNTGRCMHQLGTFITMFAALMEVD